MKQRLVFGTIAVVFLTPLLSGCRPATPIATLVPTLHAVAPATPLPSVAPTDTAPPRATALPTDTPVPRPESLPLLAEWADRSGSAGPVYSVDWSPDGRAIATTARDHVKLWDGQTYEELATLEGFADFVHCARWSPDGSILSVTGFGEPIRLYGTATYTEQGVLRGAGAARLLAWSPDGGLLAAGIGITRLAQVWDVEEGALSFELEGDAAISGLAWSPDGSILAVGYWDASVILWDARTRTRLQRLVDGRNIPAENDAQGLSWSPDGRFIAYIQRHEGRWRLWDTQTGKLVHRVAAHNSQGFGLAWSPTRPLIASVGWDRAVRIWDVETGQVVGAGACSAQALRSVDWSPDGQRIVVGSGLFYQWSSPEIICVFEVP